MKLNLLSPAPGSKIKKVRLGRGIGTGMGKTCGKGHKGQKARAGGYHKVGFEGGQKPLRKRLGKFGFKSKVGFFTEELRISSLNKLTADVVTIESLAESNLINSSTKFVKIIAHGDLTKKVSIKVSDEIRVSAGAKTLIEKSGGTLE